MIYYFAYGSNMDPKQMAERCPNSKLIGKAYLSDYKLGFTHYSNNQKSAAADIIVTKNECVWGLVYELIKEDLDNLDKREGHPNIYRRIKEIVFLQLPTDLNFDNFTDDHSAGIMNDILDIRLEPKFKEIEAFTYEVVNKLDNPGMISLEYLEKIQDAAFDNDFPENYLKQIDEFGKKGILKKNREAIDSILKLMEQVNSNGFQDLCKEQQEWGGAKLIITGSLERKEKSLISDKEVLVVLSPFWKELSYLIKNIYYDDVINWQINGYNKYYFIEELGKGAIEYQENNSETGKEDYKGICEAVLNKAYVLFTNIPVRKSRR